jgi:iron complex transport system ATP-binding protein
MKLEARDIRAGYGGDFEVEFASLSVQERAVTGLIGPNGAGKSTLLRVLSRSLNPRHGVVLLDGEILHKLPTRQVAQKLAFVGHNADGLLDLTVLELVQRGRYPHRSFLGGDAAEDRRSVEWAVEAMHLGPLCSRRLNQLSHGELRRAWAAVALAQRPDILLLDEPTAFLDIAHQLELLDLLSSLKDHGVTVIMSMHDLLLTSLYCQRVVAIADGRIACHGPTEEVLTPELVREVFHVDVEFPVTGAGGRRLLVPYRVFRNGTSQMNGSGTSGRIEAEANQDANSPH